MQALSGTYSGEQVAEATANGPGDHAVFGSTAVCCGCGKLPILATVSAGAAACNRAGGVQPCLGLRLVGASGVRRERVSDYCWRVREGCRGRECQRPRDRNNIAIRAVIMNLMRYILDLE